jgi:hypothetical protein
MNNIESYTKDSFLFYEEIISRKKDISLVGRLKSIETLIKKSYLDHESNFLTNSLVNLVNLNLTQSNKDDLLKLYSSQNTNIKKLKNKLTTDKNGRKSSLCQNCTLSEVHSLDHFLPKVKFPEYSVNPKNLFPSCSRCNSFKSNKSPGLFLNLYLDTLPPKQYLFVDISKYKDGSLEFDFQLKNTNNIDLVLFKKIESHFNELHLSKRFREICNNEVTVFLSIISRGLQASSLDNLSKIIQEDIAIEMDIYGNNYWKSVLKKALLDDEEIINNIDTYIK